MKTKKVRTHLVTDGDTFFGANQVACKRPLSEIPKEQGVLGYDGTFGKINCRECQRSKDYRELCEELGEEHPFSKAAKKAHDTMERREKGARESLRTEVSNLEYLRANYRKYLGPGGSEAVGDCIDKLNEIRKGLG